MRLHHLSVTGFGPFAQTQEVDFDDVSASGLFLIHGPTGAGKSSILDAVCFALYAAVPGARAGARASLVSDHATASMVPEVTLDFTASGRRFRVVRSPEFERVKKRGTGTTTVQSRVVLQELTGVDLAGAQWVSRGTRLDEAALVIKDVVGMGLEQFNKVVLLPQGEFAAFLRAKDEERRSVLQRLFDTQRFSDIEAWFAGRRRQGAEALRAARADLATGLLRVDDVLAGLALAEGHVVTEGHKVTEGHEVAEGNEGPEGREGAELVSPKWDEVPGPEIGRSLDGLLGAVDALAGIALVSLEVVRNRLGRSDTALVEGRQRAERQRLAAMAAERIRVLDAAGDVYDRAAVQVRLAERAAAVAGHLAAADAAAAAADSAAAKVAVRRVTVDELITGSALDHKGPVVADGSLFADGSSSADVEAIVDLVDTHTDSLTRLSTLCDQGDALAQESRAHAQVGASHESSAAAAKATMVSTLALLDESAASRDATRLLAADLATRLSHHKAWARINQVMAAQRQSCVQIDLAQAKADSAAMLHLATREHLVDLRERRLSGMAAELGSALTEGVPCPVCGSSAHPSIATSDDNVTPEDITVADLAQSAAAEAISVARSALAAEQARHDTYAHELAAGGIDLTHDEVQVVVADAREAIDVARKATETLSAAEQSVESMTAEIERLRQGLDSSVAAQAKELALSESTAAKAVGLTADADALLAEHAQTCPCRPGERAATESTAHHRQVLNALGALVVALRDQATRDETAVTSLARLTGSLRGNGFRSQDDARSAALPADQVTALTVSLRATEQERAEATALSQQPEVIEAAALPRPDLEVLGAAHLADTEAHHDAHRRHTLCEQAQRALRSRVVTVTAAVVALGPAERDAQLMESLADAVGGSGPDNARRLRLSAYVLGARLAEVATFANERLSVMSDGRYALVHHDGKGSHGARGGLGLRVSDSWTGRTRDTASLSGGESFMASLALALGLGDAVRAEAGGFDLETLFVDEGFGSLDEESLEQVMSVLDDLREGGRTVGIVSHVAELRQRIPSQLRVEKGQSGSTIRGQVDDMAFTRTSG